MDRTVMSLAAARLQKRPINIRRIGSSGLGGPKKAIRVRSIFIVQKRPRTVDSAGNETTLEQDTQQERTQNELKQMTDNQASEAASDTTTSSVQDAQQKVTRNEVKQMADSPASEAASDTTLLQDEEPLVLCKSSRVQYGSCNTGPDVTTRSVGIQKCLQICSRGTQTPTTGGTQGDMSVTKSKATCSICGSSFSSVEYLLKHCRAMHSEGKTYQCNSCSYSSNRMDRVTEHEMTAHMQLWYACPLCSKEFAQRNRVGVHMRNAHKGATGGLPKTSSIPRRLVCQYCSMEFAARKQLKEHLHTHALARFFDCTESFAETSRVKSHGVGAPKREFPHKCPHCKLGYVRLQELRKHVQKKHP